MISLPLWDWPTAIALAFVGLVIGILLIPHEWHPPVFALLSCAVPSLFFLFLSVLRMAIGLAAPFTTWSQWLVFAIGMVAGVALRERRPSRG